MAFVITAKTLAQTTTMAALLCSNGARSLPLRALPLNLNLSLSVFLCLFPSHLSLSFSLLFRHNLSFSLNISLSIVPILFSRPSQSLSLSPSLLFLAAWSWLTDLLSSKTGFMGRPTIHTRSVYIQETPLDFLCLLALISTGSYQIDYWNGRRIEVCTTFDCFC